MRYVALAALVLFVFSGCNTDYEVPLPAKYVLGRLSPGEFVIVAPDHRHILVGPTVDEYAVVGSIITGQVRTAKGARSYFVIDTNGSALFEGLGSDDWNRKLATFGIREVHLAPPTRPARRFSVSDWLKP